MQWIIYGICKHRMYRILLSCFLKKNLLCFPHEQQVSLQLSQKEKNSLNKGISLNCDSEMLWGNNYIILVNNFPNEKLGGQN